VAGVAADEVPGGGVGAADDDVRGIDVDAVGEAAGVVGADGAGHVGADVVAFDYVIGRNERAGIDEHLILAVAADDIAGRGGGGASLRSRRMRSATMCLRGAALLARAVTSPLFTLMRLRSAGVTPPFVACASPVALMPVSLPAAAVPVGSVPM